MVCQPNQIKKKSTHKCTNEVIERVKATEKRAELKKAATAAAIEKGKTKTKQILTL